MLPIYHFSLSADTFLGPPEWEKENRRGGLKNMLCLLIDKRLYKSVKGNPPGIPSCGKIPQCSLALIILSGNVCVQNVWVGDKLDLNL